LGARCQLPDGRRLLSVWLPFFQNAVQNNIAYSEILSSPNTGQPVLVIALTVKEKDLSVSGIFFREALTKFMLDHFRDKESFAEHVFAACHQNGPIIQLPGPLASDPTSRRSPASD
jgi:hypothetical protein